MNSENFNRYLDILGLQRKNPNTSNLEQIILAHLKKIPFENISKLFLLKKSSFKGIPDLKQYLDGIIEYRFGGTCYANNFHLHQLLKYLGYDVKLCGADMNRPDVHIVNIVNLDGKEFIVDVGYAAPFMEPLPLGLLSDFKIFLGTDEYVLNPMDEKGRIRLNFYRDGELKHGYYINPTPRRIEEFSSVILDSFRQEATFMNSILLVRFDSNFSQVLHNNTFIESRGKNVKKISYKTKEEIVSVINKIFLIPKEITNVALEGLSMTQDAWN
jgi:arylamine N-acetyltransferase